MAALFLAPLYILVNLYIMRWLVLWMGACHRILQSRAARCLVIAVYAALATAMLTGFLIRIEPLRRILKTIGFFWLGCFAYTLQMVILFDLARIALRHSRWKDALTGNHWFAVIGGIALFLILAVSVYGIFHARNIKVKEYTIEISQEKVLEEPLRIALVADLHLGYSVGERHVKNLVEEINSQDVDLVCIAGDIFDNEYEAIANPDRVAEILSGIKSRYGVYACWGNHDVSEKILAGFTFRSAEAVERDPRFEVFLTNAGIHLLEDEVIEIDNRFYLAGRKDPDKADKEKENRLSPEELLEGLKPELPVFVMDHQPDELEKLEQAGVCVDLSGHTHAGQMFPGNLFVRLRWENPVGAMKKGDMWSCVTSGAGVWGPAMRIGTDSEIMIINIKETERI